MARMNRKVVVLFLVVVVSAVIAAGVWWFVSGESNPMPYIEEGQALVADGKYSEALLPLQKANEISGGKRAMVLALMGECYRRMRPEPDIDKAGAYYNQAKQVADPGDPSRSGYIKALAEISLARRAYARAILEGRELVAAEPGNDAHYRLLANIYQAFMMSRASGTAKKEALDNAMQAIDAAIAKGPTHLENYLHKVQLLSAQDAPDALKTAETLVKGAIDKVDKKADALAILGSIYRQQARRPNLSADERTALQEKAAGAYGDALADDAVNLSAMIGVGQLALEQGDTAEAEVRFRTAIEKNPKKDQGYVHLVSLLHGRRDVDAALEVAETALATCEPIETLTDIRDIDYRYRILSFGAEMLIAKKEYEKAEQRIDEMRAMRPRDPSTFSLSGRVAFRRGQYDLAYDRLTRAVALQIELARSLRTEGYRQQAHRQEAEYRYNLGLVYAALNLHAKALQEYDEALGLLTSVPPADRATVHRERARELVLTGQYAEAVQEARRLLQLVPEDYTAFNVLASGLLAMGDTGEALPAAERCIALAPDRFESYTILAATLARMDEPTRQEQVLLDGLEKVETKPPLYRSLIRLYRRQEAAEKLVGLQARFMADDSLSDEQKASLKVLRQPTDEDRLKVAMEEVDKDPENPAKISNVAAMLVQLEKNDEALALYRKAYNIALKQGNMSLVKIIWDRAWVLLIGTDEPDEARQWIKELPDEMVEERQLAEGLIEMFDSAKPPADQIEGLPQHKIVQVRAEHARKAIALFEKLLADQAGGPPNVRVLRALAQVYFRLASLVPDEQTKALKEAERYRAMVVELVPQDMRSRLDLATIYMGLRQYGSALLQVAEVLNRNPESLLALGIKAECHRAMTDYRKAIATREQIRSLAPTRVDNLLHLALLHEVMGDRSAAVTACREAVRVAPKAAEPTSQLAQRLYLQGGASREEADALIKQFVADSDHKAGALMVTALYYKNTQRAEQAIGPAREAMAVSPDASVPVLFLGRTLLEIGQGDEAVRVTDDYLERFPDNVGVRMQLADILMASGVDLERAERELKRVIEAIPNSIRAQTVLARVWTKMAAKALQDGQAAQARPLMDRAEQKLTEILARMPEFGEALYSLAELSRLKGDKREAVDHLAKVSRSDVVYPRAVRLRASISESLGNVDDAIVDLENVVRVEPRDRFSRLRLANLYARKKRFDDAVALLREALDTYMPDNPELLRALTRALLAQGTKLDEAQAVADRVVTLYPDALAAWMTWVDVMRARGKAQEALQRVQPIITAHEDVLGYRLMEADLYAAMDQSDKAIAIVRELRAKHPEEPLLYTKEVDIMVYQSEKAGDGRISQATADAGEKILRDGLARTEGHLAIAFKLMQLCEESNQLAKGESLARELLAKHPENVGVMVHLGQCLLAQKKRDEAFKMFQEATNRDPRLHVAWNNMAWILALQKRNLSDARVYAEKALNLMPDHPDLLDTAGWIKYLLTDHEGAIASLERSLAAKDSPGTRFRLGMAYKGRSISLVRPADKKMAAEKAKEALEQYLLKEPSGEYAQEAREALNEVESVLKEL